MADERNPPRRREFPLPVPPEELPRLPEVSVDTSSDVTIGNRRLEQDRDPLSGVRELPAPPSRQVRPATGEKSRRVARPPERSAHTRVGTAQHLALIGGRYHIVKRIGQGGMGKVYEVTHVHLARRFALKIISSQVAETDEARDLFYREARFASAMSHPGITSVVDFGEDEAVGMFMVMEFVDGEPLNRILFREQRLGLRKACDIVLHVAEALHYIHRQNVVHCDIKTENILIGEQEVEAKRSQMVVKLLDFGLARSLVGTRGSSALSGTPHYVAPERIRGEPASPASDVYGVGILLYELLTGHVPWDGPVQEILAGHLEQVPRSPSSAIPGGLDPAVEKLVLHALAKHPRDRHKDMAAFIYELRTVTDMLGFGRRRNKQAGRRVVIEQKVADKVARRDELARITFDGCRLPLALLAPSGQIIAANSAFATFVMGVSVEVEGLPVKSTPLARAWPTATHDIARTLAGSPVRRVIEIEVSTGEVRRLLLWLDVVPNSRVVLGVHPLEL